MRCKQAVVQKEYTDEFSKEYATWIIAYCPDTNEFFVTRQRGFFWEDDTQYESKDAAIQAFTHNVPKYVLIKNDIMKNMGQQMMLDDKVWLSNTEKWYSA